MSGRLIFHAIGTLVLLTVGILLTVFAVRLREYFFTQYKESAERTGFLASWVDWYPGPVIFRITGIVVLAVSAFLMIVFVRNLRE